MPTIPAAPAAPSGGGHDYEAADTLVVREPEQMRALADGLRSQIVALLRERARSTQELSLELGIPKGTVGHHLKVLERAGLIHVVRTRNVRAVVEKFYGRTARLFLFETENADDARALGATTLRQAASEIERAADGAGFGLVRARLTAKDARRLERRLQRLLDDFRGADSPGEATSALAVGWWKTEPHGA